MIVVLKREQLKGHTE